MTRHGPRGWVVVLTAALLAAAGCEPTDVVVADLPPLDDGGRPTHPPPCAVNGDCRPQDFCEKPSCGALVGQCRPRPVFCPLDPMASCGCNGVTYWNDCVRRLHGVASAVPGECVDGAACSSSTACPDPAASCARLLPAQATCAPDLEGACWVLPEQCPAGAPAGGAWLPCSGAATCVGVCEAIASQAPHRRANTCP